MARFDEYREDRYGSVFMARSRGEDRFLHRTITAGLQRHEVPEDQFTQRFLRKGCGEDFLIRRIHTVGSQAFDRGGETAIPIFLKRGHGEDPLVPRVLGYSNYLDQIPYDTGAGQFLSRGSFLFVAPDIPVVHHLSLRGVAYDAFVFDDYAVLFPSQFIKVGSDAVATVVVNPVSWQYLARTKGRWGR